MFNFTIREMQIKIALSGHIRITRVAYIKKLGKGKCWQGCDQKQNNTKNECFIYCWWA